MSTALSLLLLSVRYIQPNSSNHFPLTTAIILGSHPPLRLSPHICRRGGGGGGFQLGYRIFLPESLFDPFRPYPDNAAVLCWSTPNPNKVEVSILPPRSLVSVGPYDSDVQ